MQKKSRENKNMQKPTKTTDIDIDNDIDIDIDIILFPKVNNIFEFLHWGQGVGVGLGSFLVPPYAKVPPFIPK